MLKIALLILACAQCAFANPDFTSHIPGIENKNCELNEQNEHVALNEKIVEPKKTHKSCPNKAWLYFKCYQGGAVLLAGTIIAPTALRRICFAHDTTNERILLLCIAGVAALAAYKGKQLLYNSLQELKQQNNAVEGSHV